MRCRPRGRARAVEVPENACARKDGVHLVSGYAYGGMKALCCWCLGDVSVVCSWVSLSAGR